MTEELVRLESNIADVPEEVSEQPLAANPGSATVHTHRAIRHLVSEARGLPAERETLPMKRSRRLALL